MSQPSFIQLHDGTLIDTATGKAVPSTEINKAFSDESHGSLLRAGKGVEDVTRRYLDDLPTTPVQSRAVAIVLSYTLFGLHELDISRVLGISTKNVHDIQESDAYAKFLEAILQNIREHDQDVIRKKLNKAAASAVDKIVQLKDSPDEKVALTASKDILDRVDRDNDNTSGGNLGGLTIRIIDDRDSTTSNVEVEIDG